MPVLQLYSARTGLDLGLLRCVIDTAYDPGLESQWRAMHSVRVMGGPPDGSG
jgi:hypothetical protein